MSIDKKVVIIWQHEEIRNSQYGGRTFSTSGKMMQKML